MEVFRAALTAISAGEPVALATVIDATGSTPRHPGAHMLVRQNGEIVGTVGGGRIELAAIELGVAVCGGAPAARLRKHLVRDLAMCCGGAMELYVEAVAPSADAVAAAVAAADDRRPVTLITPLGGGVKRVEPGTVARRARIDGDDFVEPIAPPERLVLFGVGHVARAIGPLAAAVGFDVVVCDDGEIDALDEVPAWASRSVDSFELRDVDGEVGELGLGDYVVILTRDHMIDQRILEAALPRRDLTYLGLIGSRGKLGRFRRRLEAKGIGTDADWERLHSPVGLDIGAETPEEIAVAIVAELIRERRA